MFQSIDPMKKGLIISTLAVVLASCSFLSDITGVKPKFDEFTIKDVTATSLRWESRNILTSSGDYKIQEYGFMYSTNPDIPTDAAIKDGTDYAVGYYNFSDNIEGLSPNTTYYCCLYCLTTTGKYFKSEAKTITTHPGGDYSQVRVKSPLNDDVELGFIGCYRLDSKVLVEVTVKNLAIRDADDFRIYYIGYGDDVDGRSYTTYIQDDQYTDYLSNDMVYEMNGRVSTDYYQGTFFSAWSIPLGATRKLKMSIHGVPANVNKLDIFVMSYFYNYSGCPRVYMCFENVPIY